MPPGAANQDATIDIAETAPGAPPSGFTLLGQQVNINVTPGTTFSSPITIVFQIDSSLLSGIVPGSVQVFRNGVAVPDCTGAGGTTIPPDPCVASRTLDGQGDLNVTVKTTVLSGWLFGVLIGPSCNGLPATKVGTNGDDIILGTRHRDVIVALGGNDLIFGRNGDDVICAGNGNDLVFGLDGEDWIDGGAGKDLLFGGDDEDELFGGTGKDLLFGGDDDDELDGGPQRDACHGGSGHNTFVNCEFKFGNRHHHDDDD